MMPLSHIHKDLYLRNKLLVLYKKRLIRPVPTAKPIVRKSTHLAK